MQQTLKRRLPLVSLSAAALALACGGSSPTDPGGPGPRVVGSGNFVTESRSISGFNGVSLSVAGKLIIEQTGVESLAITAEDNILPLLRSDVVGGHLELGLAPGIRIWSDGGVAPLRFQPVPEGIHRYILS